MIEGILGKHVEALKKNITDGMKLVAFFEREREWLESLAGLPGFPPNLKTLICEPLVCSMNDAKKRVQNRLDACKAMVNDEDYSPL